MKAWNRSQTTATGDKNMEKYQQYTASWNTMPPTPEMPACSISPCHSFGERLPQGIVPWSSYCHLCCWLPLGEKHVSPCSLSVPTCIGKSLASALAHSQPHAVIWQQCCLNWRPQEPERNSNHILTLGEETNNKFKKHAGRVIHDRAVVKSKEQKNIKLLFFLTVHTWRKQGTLTIDFALKCKSKLEAGWTEENRSVETSAPQSRKHWKAPSPCLCQWVNFISILL